MYNLIGYEKGVRFIGLACILLFTIIAGCSAAEDRPSVQANDQTAVIGNTSSDNSPYEPQTVETLPDGYIALDAAETAASGRVHYRFFETLVWIESADGEELDHALVSDTTFIVTYQGAYHVNKQRFENALSRVK